MHEFQRRGTTIVVVSHILDLIRTFCERAIWLEHGRIVTEGPAVSVVEQYRESVPHAVEDAVGLAR